MTASHGSARYSQSQRYDENATSGKEEAEVGSSSELANDSSVLEIPVNQSTEELPSESSTPTTQAQVWDQRNHHRPPQLLLNISSGGLVMNYLTGGKVHT